MPGDELNIRELLLAYTENRLSPLQAEELFRYISTHEEESERLLRGIAAQYKGQIFDSTPVSEEISQRMKQALLAKIKTPQYMAPRQGVAIHWKRWVAVAAAFMIICTSAYLLGDNDPKENKPPVIGNVQHTKTDALPGYDGAILTTANGSRIVLDSASNGVVSNEKSTQVVKQGNQLIYNKPTLPDAVAAGSFNTLSTIKGRKFQLELEDGTKVWLDAASMLTYPVSFSGRERRVKASGQLYFEVAKDSERPFIVEVGNTTVQVLGTHFNINAYDDETTLKTTLLEGAVKISGADDKVTLKPGQQAVTAPAGNGKIRVNNDVDIDAVMAWRRGLFQFSNADLTTVLRQLARWYDMEIVYEGKIPQRKFEGKIGRDLNLSQVVKLLEKLKVQFRIEGNRLIVES